MLATISAVDQTRMAAAMATIENLLDGHPVASFALRAPRHGDIGWVVKAHGELYWREYGWDERFEALVAGIAAQFVRRFDPKRERCWTAERDGENVGSVFLVRQSARTAKLRLLLVDPKARGLGLGRQLVGECISFARTCGYRTLVLWTQESLLAARHLYAAAGFRVIKKDPHASSGEPLVAEIWQLVL